ncbi:MAG: hypothetical protein H6592_09485 [Flavobacteriales bacterium]|nr:hypothetical protein [Flavobacteriales bacterium]
MRTAKLLPIVTLMVASISVRGQDSLSTFHLDLIKVAHLDKRNPLAIGAMFLVTPLDDDTAYFPPILSMGISYAVNGDTALQRIDIQNDPLHRVQLEIFDKDIATKAPHLYVRIKELVTPEILERSLLLFFRMRNISEEPIERIELVYGLWEKSDPETRIERHFKAEMAD